MEKISEQLVQLSDKLDKAGKTKCANAIDGLIEHQSLTKVAQYVGVIGYVLKQNRAMGNCIRKKRVSSTGSMQEVVLGCLKEYQDGQDYHNTEWVSKYAQVIQQFPEQFASVHIDFLEILAEENNITQHIARVKQAQTMLRQEKEQSDVINQIAFDLESLDRVLKEGDADPRPFKVAAPQSPRSRWSRFWSPSWSRGGKDKDTQFEMDAVLDSLMNIQGDVQQIRGGISQLRYQSRATQDPTIQQSLQALSDTNWEQTTSGIHNLQQALGVLQRNDPANGIALNLVQTTSQIEENIEQVFDEIKSVQQNMYNLRLRDPVKGRGSLKSATEEYGDLARTLDRLYINPLDERALHYSLKLHGRLEDTLNERAGAQDPSFNEWVNAPGSELGSGRFNPSTPSGGDSHVPVSNPAANPSMTMQTPSASDIETSLLQMTNDPNVLAVFVNWLEQMSTTPKTPESGQAITRLYDSFKEKQDALQGSAPTQSQPNVVQTENAAPVESVAQPTARDLLASARDPNKPWQTSDLVHLKRLLNQGNTGITASDLQKLVKIADVLNDWDSDLAELLRDYIEEEEDLLPDFPSTSSIIKEQQGSRRKLTQKKAGAVALST